MDDHVIWNRCLLGGKQMNGSARYHIAIFGDPEAPSKTLVDRGYYPREKGFSPDKLTSLGDFLLLYCTQNYGRYQKEVPGMGVIIRCNEQDGLVYRYIPFESPIPRSRLRSILTPEESGRFGQLRFRSNWLFEIGASSFWNAVDGCKIESRYGTN